MNHSYNTFKINNRIISTPNYKTKIYEKVAFYKLKRAVNYKIDNISVITDKIDFYLKNSFVNFVIKTDIKDFYNSIDVTILKSKLELELKKSNLSTSLYKELYSFISNVNLSDSSVRTGSSLSPILSYIYIKDVLEQLTNIGLYYINYYDDFLIFSSTYEDSIKDLNIFEEALKPLGLQINRNKTTIKNKLDINKFLGFKFKPIDDTCSKIYWDIKKSTQKNFEGKYYKLSKQAKIYYSIGDDENLKKSIQEINSMSIWIHSYYGFLSKFNQTFKFANRIIEDLLNCLELNEESHIKTKSDLTLPVKKNKDIFLVELRAI